MRHSVAHCYGDSPDKMFHCTLHYLADGKVTERAFYLRVSPEQVVDPDEAAYMMSNLYLALGIDPKNVEDSSLVEVPMNLGRINHLSLMGE